MSKKAVFFDIDGTLWDEHSFIPDSCKMAIRKLRENGHLAFICSGRSRGFISDDNLLGIGFDGIVGACGTYIEDEKGNILYQKFVDKNILDKTISIVKKYGTPSILEGPTYLYMDKEEFAKDPYGQKVIADMKDRLLPISEDNEKIVNKLSASFPTREIGEKATNELVNYFDAIIHTGWGAEYVPKNHSKATGIAKVMELYDIKLEDTYCFGDSMNDLSMIEFVQNGICMGNGVEELKEKADYVTSSLLDDGIFNGLKHFELI